MTRLKLAENLYDSAFATFTRAGYTEVQCWEKAQDAMREVYPEFTATFSEGWVYESVTA